MHVGIVVEGQQARACFRRARKKMQKCSGGYWLCCRISEERRTLTHPSTVIHTQLVPAAAHAAAPPPNSKHAYRPLRAIGVSSSGGARKAQNKR